MKIPKVFISYSHDSIEHKKWILELATRLRNNGIDAIIDQWALKPGDDLPHFMETQLAAADKVLMVCSEKYVTKANSGSGGVGYEKMIITAGLLNHIDANKVIPLLKQQSTKALPTFLKSKLYIDFSRLDDQEFAFDELVRAIHDSPIYKMPPVGNNPFKETDKNIVQKNHDGVLEVMKVIVNGFNLTDKNYVEYNFVRQSFGGSRIMLDMLIDNAITEGLISRDTDGDILLYPEGKIYAVNNKIA
jgi:hypothetical protein